VCIASAVAGTGAHLLYLASIQGRWCIDDAYISFRFAENLARGLGPIFNAGERVEGYTNFGWVVLLALAAELGLDLTLFSRLASAAAALLLVGLAVRFVLTRTEGTTAGWILGGLLVADGTLARWGQDGMETAFFALLVFLGSTLAVSEAEDRASFPTSSLVLATAALVRPEGLLFFGMIRVWALVAGADGNRFRDALRASDVFAAVWIPYFLWRFWYYGFLLPNTFYAKVGASKSQLARGAKYLFEFFLVERWPLLLLGLVVLVVLVVRCRRLARWEMLFLTLALACALYALLVGGDWMGPGRFLLPVVAPLSAVIAVETAATLGRPALAGLAGGLAAGALFALVSWHTEQASLLKERPALESRVAIGLWLAEHAAPGDTLLTNEIGQLAFFSRLTTWDLHGLTDPHIAHLPVAAIGEGKPGHEKSDLAYSFGKRPTWICIPSVTTRAAEFAAAYPVLREYRLEEAPLTLSRPRYGILLHRTTPLVR